MSKHPELILISAMTRDRVIGKDRALPWNIPEEYAHFLAQVRGNTVLMGRTSYEIFGPDLDTLQAGRSGAFADQDVHTPVSVEIGQQSSGGRFHSDKSSAIGRRRIWSPPKQ